VHRVPEGCFEAKRQDAERQPQDDERQHQQADALR
jgi:hypothetical protein